jgi:anti-sigma-K factor RskA
MSAHDHGRFEEDLAPYLVGALPELEAQRFEQHLRACEICQEEAARLSPAVEALPRSVPQVEPPPRLRENLMEAIRAEAPEPAAQPAKAPAMTRWSWPRLRVPAMAAAASLAAGVALGLGVASLDDEDAQRRTIAAEVDAARVPGAEGRLVVHGDGSDGAVLRVSDLPPAGRDKVYEVWVSEGGRVRPMSLFEPRSDGTAVAGVDADLDGADAVLVTRERRGGVENPTEDPVISIPL